MSKTQTVELDLTINEKQNIISLNGKLHRLKKR